MAVYKMIYRDGENPETSTLHVITKYVEAESRNAAQKRFDDLFGPKWVVAGPIKIDALPDGATLEN